MACCERASLPAGLVQGGGSPQQRELRGTLAEILARTPGPTGSGFRLRAGFSFVVRLIYAFGDFPKGDQALNTLHRRRKPRCNAAF